MNKIDPKKYYTIQEARAAHDYFGSRHLTFFYWLLRTGRIAFEDTDPEGERIRYAIKGKELIKFLKTRKVL